MKKIILLLASVLLLWPIALAAQAVVVTATVQSSSGGQPYFSGNYQVSLVDASENPLQVPGFQSQFSGILSPAGLLSLPLFPNAQIQNGSQWSFHVCSAVPKTLAQPQPASTASCFSLAVTITGAGDISSTLNASAPVFYACTQWSGSAQQSCGGSGGTTTDNLTAAASGGAAPGTTFNGSAAVTFDYHSFGAAGLAVSNTFTGTTTNDFSGTSQIKLPVSASAATLANGEFKYDTTALNWHAWVNGADLLMVPLASGFVSGDCGQPTSVGGSWTIADAGAACGTGGGGGANTALSNLAAVSINTSLLAQTGVDLGSTTKPFRNVFLFGAGTYATTYFDLTGTPTSTRTVTFPDASDTVVELIQTQTLTHKTLTDATNVFPTFNQNTTGTAANLAGCTGTAAGDLCYYTGSSWARIVGNNSGTQYLQETSSGVPSWTTPGGTGTVTVVGAGSLTSTALVTGGGSQTVQTPNTSATLSSGGNLSTPGTVTAAGFTGTGTTPAAAELIAGTGSIPTLTANGAGFAAPTTGGTAYLFKLPATISGAGLLHAAATATGDGVNESALTNSAVSLTADVSGVLPVANGGTNNASLTFPSGTATVSQTLATGTAVMNTGAVASGACETVVTVAASGIATTDTITAGFNGDPTAVTGYGASSTGAVLTIYPYPTSGNVNFKVCNSTSASITPGALTLNWRVIR